MRLFAEALDQLQPIAVFEFSHLQTYCRLRQIEAPRRCREAPELDDLGKSPELVEI
jgi:hypothetical protein